MILNDLENKFSTQNYNNLTKTSTQIQLVKNTETSEYISVSKYTFENDDIKIFKYEK